MADIEKVIYGLEYMITAYAFSAEEAQWLGDAMELLKEREAVVRCKDCKHWDAKINECHNIHSYMQYRPCFKDWFCADGGRRQDDV